MKGRQSRPLATKFKRVGRSSAEVKFRDTTIGATTNASAGVIATDSLLKAITEGNTDQTRVGNRITVKSVMLRGRVLLPSATDNLLTSQIVRIIVYLDRQANGATAAVGDILASADFRSFNNLDNSDRFRTLAETTIDLNAQGAAATAAAFAFGEVTQSFFLKAKLNLDFKFKGNAGTVADLSGNNIGVLAISQTDALGTFDFIGRVRYTDQ